jgi:hypothetical protein
MQMTIERCAHAGSVSGTTADRDTDADATIVVRLSIEMIETGPLHPNDIFDEQGAQHLGHTSVQQDARRARSRNRTGPQWCTIHEHTHHTRRRCSNRHIRDTIKRMMCDGRFDPRVSGAGKSG